MFGLFNDQGQYRHCLYVSQTQTVDQQNSGDADGLCSSDDHDDGLNGDDVDVCHNDYVGCACGHGDCADVCDDIYDHDVDGWNVYP